MFENLRADLQRARCDWKGNPPRGFRIRDVFVVFRLGTSAVISYRFAHWVTTVRIAVLHQFLWFVGAIFRRWTGLWSGVWIAPEAEIGPGLVIHTPYAINIGATRIGANCTVQTGVLIGASTRRVGDNVWFGAGAKVIGDPVIGNNVVIVANSLILSDIPDNTTVMGVPARVQIAGGRPQRFASTASRSAAATKVTAS